MGSDRNQDLLVDDNRDCDVDNVGDMCQDSLEEYILPQGESNTLLVDYIVVEEHVATQLLVCLVDGLVVLVVKVESRKALFWPLALLVF